MVDGIGSSTSIDRSQMAKKFFAKMDANSDGSLDASELSAMSKDGKGPSAEQILSKWDADGDGKISESENQTAMESAPERPGRNSSTSSADGKSQMFAELLKKFDSDGDGALNETEINSMQQNGQGPSGADMLAKFDTDGNGSIDESENAAIEKSMPPPPPGGGGPGGPQGAQSSDSTSATDKAFSSLDTNEDGVISKDELAAISSDTVNTLFEQLNKQIKQGTSYSANGTKSSGDTDSLIDLLA